jgi:hypothetical protein
MKVTAVVFSTPKEAKMEAIKKLGLDIDNVGSIHTCCVEKTEWTIKQFLTEPREYVVTIELKEKRTC